MRLIYANMKLINIGSVRRESIVHKLLKLNIRFMFIYALQVLSSGSNYSVIFKSICHFNDLRKYTDK